MSEVEAWQARIPGGGLLAMQQDMRILEATTGTVRIFQTAIVPALLQTGDYARQVLTITDVLGAGDYAAAVAARLERQHIISDHARQFEFLMTEPALCWQPGSHDVLAAQLDRIATLAALPHIAIGVIPLAAQAQAVPWTGFNVYEDREGNQEPLVTIELPHGRVVVSDPAGVEIYRDQLTLLRQGALYGHDAISFLRRQQKSPGNSDA